MSNQKEERDKIDFIKWFSELNKDSGNVAGGKGANLAEIYNLGIPVPQGFVVTAQAYDFFIREARLNEKIKKLLEKIDYEDTAQLDKITEDIRSLIINSKFSKEMEEEIFEAYENLGANELDIQKGSALDILNNASEPIFVAVRSSATTEDLAEASFAGQQDSFVNVKGKYELLNHIKKCFASLFTSRATYYRNKKGFKHEQASLAVVVQKMVDSDKSGVTFSKDPSSGKNQIIIEAVWGLGEGIVSGRITPDKYVISTELEILDKKISDKKIAITRDSGGNKSIIKLREDKSKHQVLTDYEIKKLSEITIKLEEHYKKPQDIEFAIEGEEIFIVQTRPITTVGKEIKGEPREIKGDVVLTGLAASPGIAFGKIKIIEELKDLDKIKSGDILVTKMTNPDMVVAMQKSVAIVTDEGGITAHAAIVSREMGIPAIVGTQEATAKLKEGEIITVDGFNGKIYRGKTSEMVNKEILPVTVETKIEIKVMVDLPSFAERAAKTGIKKVGLTRMEGIIAESGKHPEFFLKQNRMEDYEEIIFMGIQGIAKYFEEIWVRTSDIRTDEFGNLKGAPQEKEANPMLGLHGIRYGIVNPKILKAELKALKRVSNSNTKVGLLLPQIISVEEVKEVKKLLNEIDFSQAKVGVMVETPAAVQLIRELCDEGIDFISFGTNDLTQYILAVDRGNEKVQHLYNEMHPAVLHQLEYAIRVCKRNNVETSICGQAGSKKEMAKFLVEKKIDSISVNADVAKEISDYVAELESEKVKGTDEEPRQYQPVKEMQKINSTQDKLLNEEAPTQESPIIETSKLEVAPPNDVGEQDSIDSEIPEQNSKDIEKDIQAIEEEKQEYLEEHPEKKPTEGHIEEKEEAHVQELDIFEPSESEVVTSNEVGKQNPVDEQNSIDKEKSAEEYVEESEDNKQAEII